jgi:two-component system nitrogen regulation sensor histidine kinase NtrY
MTSAGAHRGSLAPALALSIVVVAATLGTVAACGALLPGTSTRTVVLAGGAAATLVTFIIHRLVAARLVWNGVFAVSDGLLSLSEGDYGVRLAVEREDEVGRLVRRFNTLAETLRRDRSGSYQKELLLERVLAASTTIAVIVNEAGRVIYGNPSAEQFFAAGKKVEGALLPELMAAGPRELQEAANAPHDILFTLERSDASEPETFHLARHYFEISTQRHTLFMLKPLTKELARKEVETWKKAIRVLSHEVNNSLAPITSLVHSARLMLANPASFQQRLGGALDTIEERAIHLKTFLDGYASFARLPLPAKRAVPWKDLLAGVEGLYPFKLGGPPPAEPAFLDPSQMQQVIINLLKNAAESGSAPDHITLVIRPDGEGGGVEIVVRDRGKGMSPDVLRNALLPFYSTKKAGTGLGLALCREIVEAHGGRLSLHPREAGGLAVHCWLPAESSLASLASSTTLTGLPAASNGTSPGGLATSR